MSEYLIQSSQRKLTLPLGVRYVHEADVDIITWENKDIPKGTAITVIVTMFAAWLFWVVFTAYVAYGYVAYGLFTIGIGEKPSVVQVIIFFVLLLLFSFIVPSVLFSLAWRQTLTISDNDFCVSYSGKGVPKNKCFSKESVLRLFYHRDESGESSVPALGIMYRKQIWEITTESTEALALWMSIKEKHQLFLFLREILIARGWNIDYIDYGEA